MYTQGKVYKVNGLFERLIKDESGAMKGERQRLFAAL
jgi:hypothetical protein